MLVCVLTWFERLVEYQSMHGGARVPHAQIEGFMQEREVRGEKKWVPFTSKVGDIHMDSATNI